MAVSMSKKVEDKGSVTSLFKKAQELTEAILKLESEKADVYQKVAELTCPYKVGQTLITKEGIGQNGLVIQSIVAARTPTPENRWGLQTFALSKSGELTRRSVLVEEDSQWGGVTGVK